MAGGNIENIYLQLVFGCVIAARLLIFMERSFLCSTECCFDVVSEDGIRTGKVFILEQEL